MKSIQDILAGALSASQEFRKISAEKKRFAAEQDEKFGKEKGRYLRLLSEASYILSMIEMGRDHPEHVSEGLQHLAECLDIFSKEGIAGIEGVTVDELLANTEKLEAVEAEVLRGTDYLLELNNKAKVVLAELLPQGEGETASTPPGVTLH